MKKILVIITLFVTGFTVGQGNYSLAENYFRQGEYKKASQIFESLFKKSPYNTRYLKRYITCLQETDQFNKAEKVLRNKLIKNPSQKYLHVEIGYNFDRQEKRELGKKEYETALQSIKDNPSLGGITVRMFQQNNLLDYAIEAYTKSMQFNEKAKHQFQIAQIYGEKGLFDKMFDSYIDLIDKDENYIGSVQRLVSRYVNDNPKSKNNTALKRSLLKKSISNPKDVWNEFLSWLFTKQKEYGKAFIQEKALFKRNPDYIDNIFRLGRIAFNDNDLLSSKNCFNFLLENTVFIDEKITAELYLLKIEVKEPKKNAYNLFEKVLKKYGANRNTIDIQVTYADYLTFQLNNPTKAKEVLEKALTFSKSKFEKARIKLKLGDILVFTGKFNKALIYFSEVQTQLKNHPLSQEARFKVAQTSYFKGDFNWAKSQLKVLKSSTTQLIANDAVDLFLVISDNEPKDSIPSGLTNFAKADLLAYQNRNTEAIAIYNTILKEYQGQDIEDETLYNQAKIYLKEKQFENAITNLLKIITIDKEGILVDDSYYLLAEIYKNDIKDDEKASEYYQKIIFEKATSIYLVDARKNYRKLRGDTIN